MTNHRVFALRKPLLTSSIAMIALLTLLPGFAAGQCVGDCDGDGSVTISELITGLNIALEALPLTSCEAFDRDADGVVSIDELSAAVVVTLHGCAVQPTLQLSVTDFDGAPIADVVVVVSERGERRTTEHTIEAPTSTVRYAVEDPTATIVIRIKKSGYHDEVALVQPTAADQSLAIHLVPSNECLPIGATPPDPRRLCPEPSISDQFVPCEVIVGFDSHLTDGEMEAIVTRYCVDFRASIFTPQSISMRIAVVNADLDAVLEFLNADPRVAWAKLRGGAVTVQFRGANLNDATDLIESIPGVNWLQTSRSPQAAVVEVDPGTETIWASRLRNAPGVRYTELNTIIRIPPLPFTRSTFF